MSDSDESGVTINGGFPGPFLRGLSDIGSPRADDHEYLELPGMPEDPYVEAALLAPPSPDYVPGPEEPEQAPPSPYYVLGPEHTDDEIVVEDQPDAEMPHPLLNRGDDGDDEDEPSKEDEDDDVDMEADGDEEEEEHPAPEDLFVLLFLLQVPTPVWSDAEVASLLAILLHPSSPLSTP
ncbi:hypothetical protein Tco_1254457 [Tanacetum coccineum]